QACSRPAPGLLQSGSRGSPRAPALLLAPLLGWPLFHVKHVQLCVWAAASFREIGCPSPAPVAENALEAARDTDGQAPPRRGGTRQTPAPGAMRGAFPPPLDARLHAKRRPWLFATAPPPSTPPSPGSSYRRPLPSPRPDPCRSDVLRSSRRPPFAPRATP